MMHPDCAAPGCRRTTPDGTPVCGHCWDQLARRLPDVIDQLLVTLTRQDHLGGNGGRGKGAEQPLPVRLDVGLVLDAVSGELIGWARDLVEIYRMTVPDPPRSAHPQLTLAAYAARFLAEHVGQLRTHPAAREAYRALSNALAEAEAKIDRPEPHLFIGRCDIVRDRELCGANLYAPQEATSTRCPRCRTTFTDVPERWDAALLKLRGYPATAAVIAGHIGALYGVTINRKTINSWHHRGRLAAVDQVDDGHDGRAPRFKIGDVLDLARRGQPEQAG